MYALMWHNPAKSRQKFIWFYKVVKYAGSFDVFVFYVGTNFTKDTLADLNFGQNVGGMENVLIWHFEKHMGYQILNLCKIIHVYHNHCIHVN